MQKKDWRIRDQYDYLRNKTLYLHHFDEWSDVWDHEHCAFCFAKFSKNKGDFHEGYSTLDDYYWICNDCYKDFKEEFYWHELEPNNYPLQNFKEILKKEIGLFQGKEIYSVKRVTHLLKKFALSFEFAKPVEITPAMVILSPNRILQHKVIFMETSCYVQNASQTLRTLGIYNQKLSKKISRGNVMLCIKVAEPKVTPALTP